MQLVNNSANLGMIEYGPLQSSYGTVWSQANLQETAAAIAYLSGDINNEGQTEIIELINNGNLGVRVYAPVQPSGYGLASNVGFVSTVTSALAWLLADLMGDGSLAIVQPWNSSGNLAFNVYSNYGANGYSAPVTNANTGPLATPVAWLAGDVNGDQNDEIVQLWTPNPPNGGPLGISVYQTDGNYGIILEGSWTNLGAGFGAIQWLVGDVDGDGTKELIQLWNNSGNLGITVFNRSASGAFQVMWSNTNMGVSSSNPVQAFAADINGDNKTEIVYLWNNGGNLAVYIVTPGAGGAFTRTWGSANLGETASSVAWLPIAASDNLTLTLQHLYNNGGNLALSIWQTSNGMLTTAQRVPNLSSLANVNVLGYFAIDVSLP